MKDFSKSETILVPHDFTPVADFALQHANLFAKLVGLNVTLTHIVKKENDKEDARKRLEQIALKNETENRIQTKATVAEGNYLSKIGEVADLTKAGIAIMGTHGVRGVQKVVGSYALKVITQSDIPYIVVQESPNENQTIDNIVIPLDFSKESKQKLYAILGVANLFKSKIHIIADYESDEFTSASMRNNIKYAANFLSENNLEHTIVELEKKNKGLVDETLNYSLKVNADLLVVMTSVEGKLSSLIMGESEQVLIANKELIPVMCMNSMKGSILAHGMDIAHGG